LDEDLHNTKQKMEQRKDMLEGGRPAECFYCWNVEDSGSISPRIALTPIYTEMEPDIIETTARLKWDEPVYPKYLEMSFSNKCQMKCSYCSTQNSSSLHEEIKKFGVYPLLNIENEGQYKSHGRENMYDEGSPMYDKFWDWFEEAKNHLKVLRVTGGEPLLHESTFKLAEMIKDTDIAFHVNSNLSISQRRVDRMIKTMRQMKNPKVYASIDTVKEQAEWIRHGLNSNTFDINMFKIIGEQIPIGLMVTFNFLSIPKSKEFLSYILQLKNIGDVKLDTPYMTNPKHLSALITDDKMLNLLRDSERFMEDNTEDGNPKKFNSGELQKFKTVVRWVEQNRFTGEDLNSHRTDFKLFIDEHDRRRGSDWHAAFPELEYFYNAI
tara:strand:+ start:3739 stop:4878 length:1140 start_codon:yes stop_codon:yes gene_type:complete